MPFSPVSCVQEKCLSSDIKAVIAHVLLFGIESLMKASSHFANKQTQLFQFTELLSSRFAFPRTVYTTFHIK